VVKVGRTSIAVKIEAWVRRGASEERIKVTEGLFTCVAIGADRRPRLVPQEPSVVTVPGQ
jgi:acyl-CoA thioesterase YciA